jgi:hypothetical protein
MHRVAAEKMYVGLLVIAVIGLGLAMVLVIEGLVCLEQCHLDTLTREQEG